MQFDAHTLNQPLTRDLDQARLAYESGSIEASRRAHQAGTGLATEKHEEGGSYVKTIVFGGLDGILTAHAVVAGAVGAHLGPTAILALGVSNVLADALSMGVGEYLSSRSYGKYVQQEYDREAWELENYPEGERQEMVELYEARGMNTADATTVVHTFAKYRKLFLDLMMKEELSLASPEPDEALSALREAVIMFYAFAIFGMVPIVGFAIVPLMAGPSLSDDELFLVACLITATALFCLGSLKARFTDKEFLRAGVETTLLGGACATIAFFVGRYVALWLGGGATELAAVNYATQLHAFWQPGGALLADGGALLADGGALLADGGALAPTEILRCPQPDGL